ncbi:MAG: putative porin, partial [Flavitalea sp.]
FDNYNFTIEETKFYNTTRPYSEVIYALGGNAEQIIGLEHTQNIRPNFNMAIQYRLVNSPGAFQNQNTNHNNYRISSWYQSKNKRYQNFFILVGNKLQSGENGGIRTDGNYLDSVPFEERSTIPTEIGPNTAGSRNFFSTNIATGTKYTNATYLFRQQYDIGQKDSVVTDSTVIPLFYPRLRLEHTVSINTYHYRFVDAAPDSAYYKSRYNLDLTSNNIYLDDEWRVINNDFSVYQFPDAKNPQQFVKAGVLFQTISGVFDSFSVKSNFTNLALHGEYRNKTRNKKWDIEATGRFYIQGYNAADYDAYASLQRFVGKKIGYLQVGFQHVNRKASFTFDPQSSFYLSDNNADFNKENYFHIFGSISRPEKNFKLSGSYFLFNNMHYYEGYRDPSQYSVVFNFLRVSLYKQFSIRKNFNWRTWVVLQQKAGDAPLNLPLFFTRNQVGYDGKLGFKNLNLSTGLELRYFTPYKSQGYSPAIGQFFYQDSTTVKMNIPEIAVYAHFNIRSFTAYVRAENLNSFDIGSGGFLNNQVLTPGYPYPGMNLRIGIFWSFVN